MTNTFHLIVMLFTVITLSGCNTNPVEKPNAYDLEQRAAEAYRNQDWQKAETYYSELITLVPGNAEVWFRLGNVYVRNNKPDEALQAYREAVIRQPNLGKAWHNMGTVSLRKTTHLYIEMLKYLDEASPLRQKAQETADALLTIIEQRKQASQSDTNSNSAKLEPAEQ